METILSYGKPSVRAGKNGKVVTCIGGQEDTFTTKGKVWVRNANMIVRDVIHQQRRWCKCQCVSDGVSIDLFAWNKVSP